MLSLSYYNILNSAYLKQTDNNKEYHFFPKQATVT